MRLMFLLAMLCCCTRWVIAAPPPDITPRFGPYVEPAPEAPIVSSDTGLPEHWSTTGPSPVFGNPYLWRGYGWGYGYRPGFIGWGYPAAWGYRYPFGVGYAPHYYGPFVTQPTPWSYGYHVAPHYPAERILMSPQNVTPAPPVAQPPVTPAPEPLPNPSGL
jgi:hypothetical protein